MKMIIQYQLKHKNINKLHLRLLDENNEPVQARSDYIINLQFISNEPSN